MKLENLYPLNALLVSTPIVKLFSWLLLKNASSVLTLSTVMEVSFKELVTLGTSVISEPSLLVIPPRSALLVTTAPRELFFPQDVLKEITMELRELLISHGVSLVLKVTIVFLTIVSCVSALRVTSAQRSLLSLLLASREHTTPTRVSGTEKIARVAPRVPSVMIVVSATTNAGNAQLVTTVIKRSRLEGL